MFVPSFILADGVTLQLGNNAWTFGPNLIIYLIVAAIVGFVAESLVGKRLPFGFVGAIIAALVGAWLLTKVIIINGIGDIDVYGIPIVRALIGAIILVAIWQLLTSGLGRGRSRYSSRRAY
jgi:uncharacterized membrane protein YeaQ/YmgE (transglycosylase-associated protein family)